MSQIRIPLALPVRALTTRLCGTAAQFVRSWTLPIAFVAISLTFIPAPPLLLRSVHVQAVGTSLEHRAVELVQAPSAKLYKLAMLAFAVGLEHVSSSMKGDPGVTKSNPFVRWRHALNVAGAADAYPTFAASAPQCALTSQLLVGIDSSSLVEEGVAKAWAASADLDTARLGFLNLMLVTAARECAVASLQRLPAAGTKQ